jgi:type I restriction enzyme R subunit
MTVHSPNFSFLAQHDKLLVHLAAQAERYVFDDPNTALLKLRQFAEVLAKLVAANMGISVDEAIDQATLLGMLKGRGITTGQINDIFHGIRKSGNAAAHGTLNDQSECRLNNIRL